MAYNFDEIIDRRNTKSFKWDKYPNPEVIPLWVADMDFRSPQAILDRLSKISEHGVMGYSYSTDELFEVLIERLKKHHQWEVKKEWIIPIPGLVPGIYASCRIAGNAGDSILTSTPVYTHLVDAISYGDRQTIDVPLINDKGYYSYDFEKIKASITPATKMLLLCNPHNPSGRMFSKEELEKLAEICLANDMVICSDEIHCDLVLNPSKTHISIASLSKEIENQTITLLSPSKTFNIAGLGCSFAIIPNEELRNNFIKAKHGMFPGISSYAIEGALAAYEEPSCEIWRQDLLAYLRKNHAYLLQEINQIEGLKMQPLDATYLAWIDVQGLPYTNVGEVWEKAGVGVMEAKSFHGKGFVRLNFGTQLARLEEAVRRIKGIAN